MKITNTLKTTLVVFAGCFSFTAYSQTPAAKKFGKSVINTESNYCGTTEYEAYLQSLNSKRASTEAFEQWIAPKVAEAKAKRLQKDGQNTNVVVTIPIVFHIIHNGDAIGQNENISDDQILSQIQVLNEDFRRMEGTNGFNTNPVGADMEIEFCLAKRDPYGLASPGIVRYNMGDDDGWSMEEVEVLKTQVQWDPTKYLNIWVVDQIYGLAAYAQFPTSSGLPGLEGQTATANTDGVAIGHIYVGSEEIYPEGSYDTTRNLGRTASHEIGHFFGLRHIWGDGNCNATDYCADTPAAAQANQGCPTGLNSCPAPGNDMIENYMDYTNDSCLNVFTQNQKDRMQAVLTSSPRRISLITSNSCTPGTTAEKEGTLNINRVNTECGQLTFEPEVVLINRGTGAITSATISYYIDAQASVTYNWSGNLASGAETAIEIPELTSTTGNHTFNATLETVNGSADEITGNNSKSAGFSLAGTFNTTQLVVTIQTDDFGGETLWAIASEDAEDIIGGNLDPMNPAQSEFYEDNHLYTVNVEVENSDCYMFIIIDLGADGMAEGGYYNVKTADGVLIAEGGEFGQTEQKMFAVDATMGTIDVSKSLESINLYPNPANNILNIATQDTINMPEAYTVYNSLGQVMGNGKITGTVQSLDIAGYAEGVYFVKLTKGGESKTLQFIKY